MKIKIKKLNSAAIIPSYAKEGDAGMDLVATSITIEQSYTEYGTGLAIQIPEDHVGLVFPRSSVSNTPLVLANSVGVIDSQYRGEIKVRFKWVSHRVLYGEFDKEITTPPIYDIGDRIAQIIIIPIPYVEFQETSELTQTNRQENGFGSTGR